MKTQQELIDEVEAVYAELQAATSQYYEAEVGLLKITTRERELLVRGEGKYELMEMQKEKFKATLDLNAAKYRMALAELAREKLQLTLALKDGL